MARVALATATLFMVTAACGIPDSGNETNAIVTLKAITIAQQAYQRSCGNGGYAASLATLTVPPGGTGQGFIDKTLFSSGTLEKSGFKFSMTAGAASSASARDCNGTPTMTAFYASAVPVSDNTGSRSFAVNQTNIVWQLTGRRAPAEPFGPPALPVQ
jgi:hypothetical protein